MRKLKKRAVLISSGVAALFIAPLIAFAVLYSSDTRKNEFVPGSVDIEVKEGLTHDDELTKELTLDSDTRSVDKPVEIKDTRKHPGEKLRVMFVPVWYDSAGNVCDVSDLGTVTPDNAENMSALTYGSGSGAITLHLAENWSDNGWSYSAPDRAFYYSGTLDNSKLTKQLLDSVELDENAYELADGYVLKLDVLADAIQSSGDAAGSRGWTE